jgi:hypothetical protein
MGITLITVMIYRVSEAYQEHQVMLKESQAKKRKLEEA